MPASVGLIVGIILDRYLPAPLWAYAVLFALAGGMSLSAWGQPRLAGLLAVLSITIASASVGAVRHQVDFWRIGPTHVLRHLGTQGSLLRLRGTILTEPVSPQPVHDPYSPPVPARRRTSFILQVEEVQASTRWTAGEGLVRISILDAAANLQAGDRIEAFVRLRSLSGPGNPGQFDWQLYQRRNGIYLAGSVNETESVHVVQQASVTSSPLSSLLAHFRRRCRAALLDNIDPEAPESGLLATYVAGYRWSVSRQIDEAFRRSGTTHILAVSGSHVIMIGAFAVGVGMLLLRRPRRALLAGLTAVLFFTLFVEPNPPALRAAVMAILGSTAILLNRPTNPMNSLAASLVILLLVGPTDLFGAGFQLSFIAVVALFIVCPAMDRWLFGPRTLAAVIRERIRHKADSPYPSVWRFLRPTFSTSLTAWAASTPLTAYYFGSLYTYGAVATLLILPAATITLAIGFCKLLLGLLLPSTDAWTAPLTTLSASWMAWLAGWCSSWPATCLPVPAPPIWLMAGFYILLLIWASADHRQQRRIAALLAGSEDSPAAMIDQLPAQPGITGKVQAIILRRVRPIPTWTIALAAASTLAIYWLAATRAAAPPTNPRIHVFSVGDGLAVLVRSPSGRTLLFDCGSLTVNGVAEAVIVPALRELGVRRIDAVVLSHPNIDHYNGLAGLAGAIPVKEVFVTDTFLAAQGLAKQLLRDLKGRNIPVHPIARGQTIPVLDPLAVQVLWPPADFHRVSKSDNDSSAVLQIEYQGRRVLLPGDAGQYVQARLLADWPNAIRADVLVLPHHGRVTTLDPGFLPAVRPELAIASAADPSRLARINPVPGSTCRLLDTQTSGMITVDLLPAGPRATEFRHRQ